MEIRIAKEEDCGALAILKRRVWESAYRGIYPDSKINQYDYGKNENKFKEIIRVQQQKLFVAVHQDEIIGYMSCGTIMRPFEGHTHDIGLLYVAKEYQGKGIGTLLFQSAITALKEEGVSEFIVSCNKYNYSAQRFYQKLGGTIIKVEEDHPDQSIPQVKFHFVIR